MIHDVSIKDMKTMIHMLLGVHDTDTELNIYNSKYD